jgi:hypothetical protein
MAGALAALVLLGATWALRTAVALPVFGALQIVSRRRRPAAGGAVAGVTRG